MTDMIERLNEVKRLIDKMIDEELHRTGQATEASWDNALDYDANVYYLKNSGWAWREINNIATNQGHPNMVDRRGVKRQMIDAYFRYAEKIGDERTAI